MNEDMILFYILLSCLIGAMFGIMILRIYYEMIGLLDSIKEKYRKEKHKRA